MYKLYMVGARTKTFCIPACVSRGVYVSPSTVTLNFLFERNGLISLIILFETAIWIVYIASHCAM
jgi:hypothetical protein